MFYYLYILSKITPLMEISSELLRSACINKVFYVCMYVCMYVCRYCIVQYRFRIKYKKMYMQIFVTFTRYSKQKIKTNIPYHFWYYIVSKIVTKKSKQSQIH